MVSEINGIVVCDREAGKKYGRWFLEGPAVRVTFGYRGKVHLRRWLHVCTCDCGQIRIVERNALVSGHSTSCGCRQKEVVGRLRKSHGKTGTPEYRNWRAMIQRCYDKNTKAYPNYGGRGIKICDRWLEADGQGFLNFLADMGPRPGYKRASVDRVDNDGDYCPENCRWATNQIQCNNRRTCKMFTIDGVTKTMADWERHYGLKPKTLKVLLGRGYSIVQAIEHRKNKDSMK